MSNMNDKAKNLGEYILGFLSFTIAVVLIFNYFNLPVSRFVFRFFLPILCEQKLNLYDYADQNMPDTLPCPFEAGYKFIGILALLVEGYILSRLAMAYSNNKNVNKGIRNSYTILMIFSISWVAIYIVSVIGFFI